MKITLPWPPTVNLYYRHVGPKVLISSKGRQYRTDVRLCLMEQRAAPTPGRLSVRVMAYPPDRRVRDLDNLWKSLLDSLRHGGAFDDDEQIDRLYIERGRPCKGGRVEVEINELVATTALETAP